jgi:hypothetical protein
MQNSRGLIRNLHRKDLMPPIMLRYTKRIHKIRRLPILESAIRSFKLPIKEKFRKSHDILEYAELILSINC